MRRIFHEHVPNEAHQLYAFGIEKCQVLGLPGDRLVVSWVAQKSQIFQFAGKDWWSSLDICQPQYPLEVRFMSKDDAKLHGAVKGTFIRIDLEHQWGPIQCDKSMGQTFYAACLVCEEKIQVFGLSDKEKEFFGLNLLRANPAKLSLRNDHRWQALPCRGRNNKEQPTPVAENE